MTKQLTNEEKLFCELYANGEIPFGGNASRCYQEVFAYKIRKGRVNHDAMQLLSEERIQEYLNHLEKLHFEDARYMKRFLTRNLEHIVTECTTGVFYNSKGVRVSPAPLRSVAVSAAKALMEMYPVKEASKLSIDGGDENGGIVFNIVVPEGAKKE